jgi:hypothetical protein
MPRGRGSGQTSCILGLSRALEVLIRNTEALMNSDSLPTADCIARYELRFRSLYHTGRALAFPCDRDGAVQWGAMTEGARASFLRAQGSVGREYASPAVQLSDSH